MLLAFHLGCVCIFALHNTCLWHIFYSGAVHRKLFVTSDVLCSVFPLCVRMYETCRLSTIQLPNFARRLKQKEVQIFTRDLPPPPSLPLFPLPSPQQSFQQGSGQLPWLGTCALQKPARQASFLRLPPPFLSSSAISVFASPCLDA